MAARLGKLHLNGWRGGCREKFSGFCFVGVWRRARAITTLHISPRPCTRSKVNKITIYFTLTWYYFPAGENKGCVFSEHAVFLRTCHARPIRAHTCPGITRRLCGGLGASVAQGLRALRLWQSSRQSVGSGAQCRGAASMLHQGDARCGARPSTY